MNFFVFNNRSGVLEFNTPEILLIKEFADLYEVKRNKCKEDKKGIERLLARKEFAYIWLKMNRRSPYFEYSELESHQQALQDSGLSKEEFDDPVFRAACRKYQEIMDSDRILKMLKAAYDKVDDITDYLENELDLRERGADGKPVFKLKDVIQEMNKLGDVILGLENLNSMYNKGQEAQTGLRANAVAGYRD